MNNTDNVGNIIRALKPYLRQYLEQSGIKINTSGKFLCPAPAKHDTVPSANFVPGSNDTAFYCHACKTSGDIFVVCNWKEGLPLRGKEFILNTVYGLAKRFGIPFQPANISEQDAEILKIQQIYEDAYSVLRTYYQNRIHVGKRGWSEGLCYQMGVATVPSWQEFLDRLRSLRNYSKADLEEADIRPWLFSPEVITFTLFDEYGRPVGFASRDTRYGKVKGADRKYINTRTNMVYNKSRILYGFHIARTLPGPLTIVEGYADVLTAMNDGIYGVTAVCGSTPTQEQIDLIERYNKRDVILALDYDTKIGPNGKPTGQSKTEQFIDEYVKGRRNMRLRITDWNALKPTDKVDLDSYLMSLTSSGLSPKDAVTAWEQIPKLDGFSWRLKNLPADTPPEDISSQMIPIIATEPVHAKQESLLKVLSERTSIRIEALQRDLDSILDLQSREISEGIRDVTNNMFQKLRLAAPDEAEAVLQEAHDRVKQLVDTTSRAKADIGSTIDTVKDTLDKFSKRVDTGLVGIKVGFPVFDEKMSGLCTGMWIFGGFPSAGKTASTAQLSWNAVNLNEESIVLVMTLDDSMDAFIARYLAIQTGFYIGHVVHPARYIFNDPVKTEAYTQAKSKIAELVTAGRLDIRDGSTGSTSKALLRWVEKTRKRYPDKKIVVFVDNFHNLTDRGDTETTRFSRASKCIHHMAENCDCCAIITAELTKNSDRDNPSRSGLKETGTLEYDAKCVIMVHNDLILHPESQKFWTDPTEPNPMANRKPLLEWNIEKNKNLFGVWTGRVPIQFDPPRSRLVQYADIPRPITSSIVVPQPAAGAQTGRFSRGWE